MTKETVTMEELARATGYHRNTLYYRRKRGLIEAERQPDGTFRVPVSEVKRLVMRDKYSRPSA